MHICKLDVAIRHAQKTAMTFPGETVPALTSFEPNHKPCTNMASMTNCAKLLVMPQTIWPFQAAWRIFSRTLDNVTCSCLAVLNALTVAIAATARSTRLAAVAVCKRSTARGGAAKAWDRAWTTTRTGTAERTTRVRDQERVNARIRQANVVVRYWMPFGHHQFPCDRGVRYN